MKTTMKGLCIKLQEYQDTCSSVNVLVEPMESIDMLQRFAHSILLLQGKRRRNSELDRAIPASDRPISFSTIRKQTHD